MSAAHVRTKFASDVERIALPDARAAMLARTRPLAVETVPSVAAIGRILAATYRANEDIVPFARSAMDGYALRALDSRGASASAPVTLPVRGTAFAGHGASTLAAATAYAITTGAMLPEGADAVVPFEDVDRIGETIVVREPLAALDHVFEPGDDARRGDVLVAAGDALTPGGAALLASAGIGEVVVYRRPRVAIVSTGDEVVAIGAMPRPGQIRNSNATMLAAALADDGAIVTYVAHAGDEPAAVRAALERARAEADLVMTTGGASTGDRDYVKATLRDLGAAFAFDSIAIRPAKPTAFATLGSSLVAVLPGNPAAAYVAYVALFRGVLRRLAGAPEPYEPFVAARLDGVVRSKPRRHFLTYASLAVADATLHVTPLDNQCSSLVRLSAVANALIVTAPGEATLGPGSIVPIIPIGRAPLRTRLR